MFRRREGTLIRVIRSAAVLGVVALTSLARAGSPAQGKTVSQINFNDYNGVPQLAVKLSDGVVYIANVVSGNECVASGVTVAAPTLETVKMWQSLLNSALLSGKSVNLYYVDCGGTPPYHWIREVDLTQ